MAAVTAVRQCIKCCSSMRNQSLLQSATSTTLHRPLPRQPLRHRSATAKRPHKHAVIPPPPTIATAPTHPYLPDITSSSNTNITLMAEPIGVREYLLYVTVALGSMFTGSQLVHWYFKPDLHIPTAAELKERERKAELQKQQLAAASPAPAVPSAQSAGVAATPPQQASSNQ